MITISDSSLTGLRGSEDTFFPTGFIYIVTVLNKENLQRRVGKRRITKNGKNFWETRIDQ